MSEAVTNPASERQLFSELLGRDFVDRLQTPSPNAVYTPHVVIWLLIYQRLHAGASLAEAVAEFLTHFPQQSAPKARHHGHTALSAGTGAYSRARSRLDTSLVRTVADHVANTLIGATAPTWNQRRVFILDGTTVTLPHTPELRGTFPPASNQHGPSHWPLLHLLVAHDLDTGLALRPEFGPMYGPHAVSELALTLRMLPRLPAGAVILADRNFGVFSVAHAARAGGRDVVVRLTESRFRSMRKGAEPERPGRWSVVWKPTRWERQSHPELAGDAEVRGWLHEVHVREGLTLWLFSTLETSGSELGSLYRRRADVETDIRDVKQTLSLDRMTGRSEGMVEKELVLGVSAYNLVNQVRRLAAKRAGVEPRRLSFAGVWSLVRTLLGAAEEGLSGDELERRFDQVLSWAGQRKLPRRRTQRSYPRTVIPRSSQFPNRKPNKKCDEHHSK